MNIERPYTPDTIIVTSSECRAELCAGLGYVTEPNGLMAKTVGMGEKSHDQYNGYGAVVTHKYGDHYSLSVVKAKAQALNERHGHELCRPHAVIDSVWEIDIENGESCSLNKPKTEADVGELAATIYACRGKELTSQTAIGIVMPSNETAYFLMGLRLGQIDPRIDMAKVTNIIRSNQPIAGGFDVLTALREGIVETGPDHHLHLYLRRVDANRLGQGVQVSGSVIRKIPFMEELSADETNNLWIKRFANGLIPSV